MKKSYSSLNVLNSKLNGQYKGFLHSFFSSKTYITIKLPYYEFLRGQIYIEDLQENYPNDIPLLFDIGQFIMLLYLDFLQQIKRGAKNEEVVAYLKESKERYFPHTYSEKRVFNQVNNNLFQFQSIEEEQPQEEGKYIYLDLRVKEKIILRGEVLIHDILPHLDGIHMTVEQLIAIVYLDFIKMIQSNGNSKTVQNSILKKIQTK